MDQSWIKKLTAQEMLQPGSRIVLIALAVPQSPVKFRADVVFFQGRILGLSLPGAWWKLADFQPGTFVRLYKSLQEGVFYTRGKILETHQPSPPHVIIECGWEVVRDQRRLFFRLEVELGFHIHSVVLPEGVCPEGCPARLTDISAGGIGFKLPLFLPPGTHMKSDDLFHSLAAEEGVQTCGLEVVWCRTFRPKGFRSGARFLHADGKAQERVARMIHRLQWRKLARKNRNPLDD